MSSEAARAVFIETPVLDRAAADKLKTWPDACLLTSRERWAESLNRTGLTVKWLGEYADAAEIQEAYSFAYRFARTWFREIFPSSILEYRGVNLGSCVQLSLGSYLASCLSDWIRLTRFLEKKQAAQLHLASSAPLPVESFYGESNETNLPAILRVAGKRFAAMDVVPPSASKTLQPKPFLRRWMASLVPALSGRPIKKDTCLFSGALHQLQPIAEMAVRKNSICWLDQQTQWASRQWAVGKGMAYGRFDSWIRKAIDSSDREKFIERLDQSWSPFFEKAADHPGQYFKGVSVIRLASERLEWFRKVKVRELAVWIDAMNLFLDHVSIQALVLDEDVLEFHRTLARVAKQRKVPTLVVLHATTPSFGEGFDVAPLTADKLAVGGEGLKQDCVRWGVPADRIAVTGVPRYARLARSSRAETRAQLQKEGAALRPKSPLVFFAATYFNDRFDPRGERADIERAYRDFFSSMADHPEADLVVRRYPRDPEPDWIERLAGEAGAKAYFLKDGDSRDMSALFAACDVAVSFPSSAVTEACLAERPVVVLDYFSRLRFSELSPEANLLSVSNRVSLEKALNGCLAPDQNFLKSVLSAGRQLAESWAGTAEGSAERVIDALEGLVHRSAHGSQVEVSA